MYSTDIILNAAIDKIAGSEQKLLVLSKIVRGVELGLFLTTVFSLTSSLLSEGTAVFPWAGAAILFAFSNVLFAQGFSDIGGARQTLNQARILYQLSRHPSSIPISITKRHTLS